MSADRMPGGLGQIRVNYKRLLQVINSHGLGILVRPPSYLGQLGLRALSTFAAKVASMADHWSLPWATQVYGMRKRI